MGAKTDTSDIELWFEETPLKKAARKAGPGKIIPIDNDGRPIQRKPLKQPQNGLQGVSSLRLVRELIVRHYKFVLSTLFWIGVGVIVGTR